MHLLSNKDINKKYFVICLSVSMATTYFSRLLLTFGTHTLINIIILVLFSVGLLKISAQKAVISALTLTILMFIFEGLIVFFYRLNINDPQKLERFLNTETVKITIGIISNVLLALTLLVIRFIKKRPKRQR